MPYKNKIGFTGTVSSIADCVISLFRSSLSGSSKELETQGSFKLCLVFSDSYQMLPEINNNVDISISFKSKGKRT